MILQSYLGAGEIGIIRAPRNIPPADEENLNVRPLYRVVEEEGIFGTGYGQDIVGTLLRSLQTWKKSEIPGSIGNTKNTLANLPYLKFAPFQRLTTIT